MPLSGTTTRRVYIDGQKSLSFKIFFNYVLSSPNVGRPSGYEYIFLYLEHHFGAQMMGYHL